MTKTPTSTADDPVSPATAHSETPAEQTPPDKLPDLGELMSTMTDHELVKVGLVAMAILHERADGSGQ